MNLQFYLKKLHASEEFKKFQNENPKMFLYSGFFVIDKRGNDNKIHFDYFIPTNKNKGKVFSFQLEKGINIAEMATNNKIHEKISLNEGFDFDDIETLIENKMRDENINSQIQKILLSLQSVNGKNFLIASVFISGLGMIRTDIELLENSQMKVVLFEKKSFMDIFKIVKK